MTNIQIRRDISDFRTLLFNAINKKDNSSGVLNTLRAYQKSIYRNSTLPEPFQSETDNFLNDLSAKVISFILGSDMNTLSSDMKKEISDLFGKILKGYTKIFVHFIDIDYYNPFFSSVLKIFDLQSAFYNSTSKSSYFGGIQNSPYYTLIIDFLLASNILEKITIFFNNVQEPKFPLFYFLLNFLSTTNDHFPSSQYKKCLESATSKIVAICQTLEGNELRDVDEKNIHNSLLLLNKLNQYSMNDVVAGLIVRIDIKFAKSTFLKKRFAGLSTIRLFMNQNVSRKKSICTLIYSEKVLEEILKDFHHQLVNDFVALMNEMIFQGFDEIKNLCDFWEVCLNQHSSTIEIFFKGLYDLTRTLPEEYMYILYKKIIDTKKYPDSCLNFLYRIIYRMNDNQRSMIYESLERFYFSNDYQPSSENQIISSMCAYIPSNHSFCQKILEKALNMIENNSHLTLSLNLLMASCNRIRSDQANKYFEMVTAHISGENSIQFLPLLQQIIFQLNRPLSNEQFQRLLEITIVHFTSHDSFIVAQICDFYEKLLRHSTSEIFTVEMLKNLFQILCKLNPISYPVFEIIKMLFIDCNNYNNYMNTYRAQYHNNSNAVSHSNSKHDLYGLNELWNLLFQTKDKYWIKFISKTESVSNIIDICMKNYKNSASLATLYYIIHSIEDSLNKDMMNIPSNIYIDPEETATIEVTGELVQRLCVSKYLSYNALLHRIALILNRKFDYLVFEEDGRSIANRDLHVKDGITINVRCLYGYSTTMCDDIHVSKLPSRLLMNEKYSSVLFNLLNDKQLGKHALKILNEMPTLEKEKIVFTEKQDNDNESEYKYEFDWESYLSLNDPLLLNYHLNIIGNNVAVGKEEWIKMFFETGGALKVVNLAVSEESYSCIVSQNCGNGYIIKNNDNQNSININKSSDETIKDTSQNTKERSIVIDDQNSKENPINDQTSKENIINDQTSKENIINDQTNKENPINNQTSKENPINNQTNKENIINDQTSKENIINNQNSKESIISDQNSKENISNSSSSNNQIKINDSNSSFIDQIRTDYSTSSFIDTNAPDGSKVSSIQKVWNTPDYNFNINFYLLLLRVARRILEVPYKEYAEQLIKSFDSQQIPDFSRLIVNAGSQTNNNINVISNMLYILQSLTQYGTLTASESANFDSLLDMTLFSPSEKIKRTIFQIIQNAPPISYQDILLPLLPKAFKMNSVDYFMLLYPVTLETNDPVSIWNKLIDLLSVHFVPVKSLSILDKLKFSIPSTQLSNGLFNVLNVLVDRIDQQIKQQTLQNLEEIPRITELFNFLVNEILLNTMKYFEITKELVNLLINLLSKKPSLGKDVIIRLKEVREARKEIQTNSDFQPNMSSRAKYKGLRNLGATCYMASLLQQLFAIPIFRDSLLNMSLQLDADEDNEKWLIELQYLFLKMLLFPSSDIDPTSFVKCWKGWDDKPINPREQQDAIEFLQMFLDRIEGKVPITKSLFKGVILHHTDGVDCDFHQNINEEYVNIPLEVKGHINVSQSFDTYRSPDRFDGNNQYRTDEFGLIDVIQTHRILTPSPQLIITLKRFEYNLSTMIREKVNTEYSFPTTLDLSPIMVDGSKKVMYDLYGVVVHMGSAQGGHYISHIKEDDGNWYIFNDRKVTIENQNAMLSASYGGSSSTQIWDDEAKTYITTTFDKGSAYLLFYRKSDYDFNSEVLESVPSSLLERLLKEIKCEILKKLESSQEYLRFVSQICVDSQFLLSFFEDSNFSIESLSTLTGKCIENCSSNPSFASEILKNIDQHISVILSDKSTSETRQMYSSIICSAMDFSPIEESQELIDKFLIKIRDEADSILKYYEAFPEFFNIFEHYFNRFQELKKEKTLNDESLSLLKNEDLMVKIWINSFNTFIIRCLDNPFVRENGDFSAVFNILSNILKNNIDEGPLLKPIHNKQSISTFLCSKINADSYTSLLVLLIQKQFLQIDEIYFILNVNDSVFLTSRLFICCLADVTNNGENYRSNLITFCNEKGQNYLLSFLMEVSSLAILFKKEISLSFFALSTIWINNWLFHKSKEIRAATLLVFKSFSKPSNIITDVNQKGIYYGIYKSLISTLPHLKSVTLSLLKMNESYKITSDELYRQLPTEEFFSLLTWSIKSGSFYKEITQNGKQLGEICSTFGTYTSEYPNIHLMSFVYQIIDEDNSKEFFKDETLGLFLKGLTKLYFNDINNDPKTTILAHFIRIIPDDRCEELFNTKFFQKVIKYIFAGEIGMIVRKKIKKNIKKLQNPEVFAKNVFQTLQCTSSLSEVCRISWILLKEIPALADIFESLGCRQCVWEIAVRHIHYIRTIPLIRSSTANLYTSIPQIAKITSPSDLVIFPALKLLGIFNKSYTATNKEKSSFFSGNYVTWLANQWDKTSIPFSSIFQVAFANTNIEFGQSGPFVFMESLIQFPIMKFASNIYSMSQQFHRSINSNTNNNNSSTNNSYFYMGGIVLKAPSKAQKASARFVVSLFDKIALNTAAQTEITDYLIDEFLKSIKSYTLNNTNNNNNNKNCQTPKVSIAALEILSLKLADTVENLAKNDSKKITKDVNYILSTTNDPLMLNKGMTNLGISLYLIHKDKMQINEWKANATRILSRILKDMLISSSANNSNAFVSMLNNDNDVINVMNFIDLIDANCDMKKTVLLLSKEDLNAVLILLKDQKSDLSLRIIQLIQKFLR